MKVFGTIMTKHLWKKMDVSKLEQCLHKQKHF